MFSKTLIMSCIAATALIAQEKVTNNARVPLTYAAKEVRVLGDLDDGLPGTSFSYTKKPTYRAFVFSAFGGEKVDITVSSTGRRPFIALTDSTLQELAVGTNHISFALPNHGPYIEVWYVVFRDLENKAARYTVQVKKLPGSLQQAARTAD